MSIHIAAKEGEIAEAILLPGDPLRAKYIADTFLEKAALYTEVRNILGYTGICIATISDSLTSAEERQTAFTQMMEVAPDTAIS
jgi:purine-nucleoside phosphorylase